MTIYARSDICAVTISVAHGGCGSAHHRPASDGNPAKLWALTCAPCENYLRSDPHWAGSVSEVPETFDESKGREDFERRGAADRDTVLATALAKLAGVDLPPALRGLIGGAGPAAAITCPSGHGCDPGSKFCGDCGAALDTAPLTCPSGHEVARGMKFCGECGAPAAAAALPPDAVPERTDAEIPAAAKTRLKDMRAGDLRDMARERGLDESGTRAELLARLRAA